MLIVSACQAEEAAIEVTPSPTAAATPSPSPTPTELPLQPLTGSGGGYIVFDLYDHPGSQGGTRDLYIMNADQSLIRRLTENRFDDHDPAWSPDGTRIAYTSFREEQSDIFVIDLADFLDGAGPGIEIQLTDTPSEDEMPRWSPDGTQIAFASYRDGDWEIYIMNADGSGQRRLTNSPQVDRFPDWSPDGTQIVFASNRGGNYDLYTIDSFGGDIQQLTFTEENEYAPVWSPDGSFLVYFRATSAGAWEIFVLDVESGQERQVTRNAANSYNPRWAADGLTIYFSLHNAGAEPGLHSIRINGASQQYLTAAAGTYTHDFYP